MLLRKGYTLGLMEFAVTFATTAGRATLRGMGLWQVAEER